jgi:hypothetical protein
MPVHDVQLDCEITRSFDLKLSNCFADEFDPYILRKDDAIGQYIEQNGTKIPNQLKRDR